MNYEIKKLEKSMVEFKITLNKEEWEQAIDKAYLKTKNKYSHQGFRKGKVPKKVIENIYGKGVFYEDAINYSFGDYYTEILDKEKDIFVVDRPDLDVEKIDEDGVVLIAKVAVKPEFELGKYKGITIDKIEYNVKDEDIENELNSLKEKNSRLIEVLDRPAADGDHTTIDYSGSVDGVNFEGGTAEKQQLILGSKQFIPGFEEQVVGMEIGEERDIKVKFPEEYHAKDLAGKDAIFKVKLHEIRKKELPEITDELIKDSTEYENIEDFKAKTREKLEKANNERAEREIEDKLVKAIVDDCKIDIPDAMIESQIDGQVKNMQYRMMYQGINLEDYLKHMNQTMEEFRAGFKTQAEEQVKTQLVISKILDIEQIKADEESLNSKIAELAKEQEKDIEEYKKTLNDKMSERLENEIVIEKLFKFLKENNNII